MARHKERDWVKVNFTLDPGIKKIIEELSNLEGISKSNFIELLVSRWDEGINPESKLNALFKKRELKQAELSEVEVEIKELTKQITARNLLLKEKAKKKPEAVKILKGLLSRGNINEAEKVSRFWQTQTGFSSFELLMEAKSELDKLNLAKRNI